MPSTLETIANFLDKVGGQEKSAETRSEPGSQGGETSHPIKNVDDNLHPATEGFRSSENTKDVKEAIKPSVDATSIPSQGSASDQESVQPQIGTHQAPTGGDPSVETSSTKDNKEDDSIGGKTSHPARTDNESLNGGKYASAEEWTAEKLASELQALGNTILAELHTSADPGTPAPAAGEKTAANKTPAPAAQPSVNLTKEAGQDLAALANGQFDQAAVDQMVVSAIEATIKEAYDDASAVAELCRAKQAEDEAGGSDPSGEEPPKKDDSGSSEPGGESGGGDGGGSGAPPEAGGGEGGGDAGLAAMLGGGGAPSMPPGGGGMGGPGGGAGGPDIAQIVELLMAMGITPEDLQAHMAGAGGGMPPGAGGGMPPGGGGDPLAAAGGGAPPMPPMGGGAPPMGGGMEVAASANSHMAKIAMTQMVREWTRRTRRRG